MSDVRDLLRSDLRDFAGYRSARVEEFVGDVWLNANESPWPSGADGSTACRRYPEPQPSRLVDALAALYDCTREQILIGRGSDEAIDLVVRASCVPGHDAIVVTPPVFGMYAVATYRMIEAMDLDFLDPLPQVFLGLALAAWLATFVGLLRRLRSGLARGG